MRNSVNIESEVRVPSIRSLTVLCAFGALVFGLLTVYSLRDSLTLFSFVGLMFTLTAIAGALFFASLDRASMQARIAVKNENKVAEGIGRGSGRLVGLVVIATDGRILAVPARLFKKPKVSVSIPYPEVTNFKTGSDSLDITSGESRISLTKCSPTEVAVLANELKLRVPRAR